MAGIRGTSHPESPELLQRLQNIERMLGITGQNAGNGPGVPNSQEITGQHKIRDANGLLRVVVGQLPSGDYGYYVADPNGVANEIWPVSSAYGLSSSQTTTSVTPIALTGTPSLSVYLGASGDALVTLCCYIGLPALTTNVTQTGLLQLNVDGSQYEPDVLSLSESSGSTGLLAMAANVSTSRRLSQWGGTLAPNTTHTFELLEYVSNASNGTVTFAAASIVVQPL